MPVVSNASPLVNLAIVDRLDLLQTQYGEVLIPDEVLAELRLDSDRLGVPVLAGAVQAGWISVRSLDAGHRPLTASMELDPGEAAAIALALQLGHRTVLMDERDGRVAARDVGLIPCGVLGVLLRAKLDGQISNLADAIRQLREIAEFRLSDALYREVLSSAGEAEGGT